MYDGDTPLAERRAAALALDRDLLAELLGSDEMRELLDPRALAAVEDELQCLDARRHARTVEAVHDLLRRLGDLSPGELGARVVGGVTFAQHAVTLLTRERRAVTVRVAAEERAIAADDAARYRDALGAVIPGGLADVWLMPSSGDPADPAHPDGPLSSLLVRYARTHGPFTSAEAAARFGVGVETVERALAHRVGTGLLLAGEFRPEGAGREWCDPDVLRQIRQRTLALLRKEIEPTTTEALARFLPDWHGVGSAAVGGGLDRLYDVIGQLQGVPLPASVWERDVLPVRLQRYTPRWLDELLAAGEVLWVGAGPLGRDDGRVAFHLRATAPLLVPEAGVGPRPDDEEHDRLRTLLRERGACFFRELDASNDRRCLDALWDLVWTGEVTNDGFGAVRALGGGKKPARSSAGGAGSRRVGRPRLGSITALGPPTAAGRWSLVDREVGRLWAPVEATKAAARATARQAGTERAHAIAVTLLERYGVLTREAVRGEGISGGFAGLYPVLKLLEDAGKVRRGYFVAGLGGAQFAVPGAVDRLRELREPKPEPEVIVLAATDPANAYGVAMPWPAKGPQRAAGAYVVLVDGLPSLYLEKGGKSLIALRRDDLTWESHAVAAVASMVGPDGDPRARFRRLVLENVPADLDGLLRQHGFVPTPKGLAKYA
jgi:ATP-dependent Lhr-like helicase